MATDPTFEVTIPSDREPGETLVLGLSGLGLAGLTATDYLVRHLESRQLGAVVPEGLPAIAPFEAGQPRHHTRLYNLPGTSLTPLVGELFVPPPVAEPFAEALLGWARGAGVEEIVVLHGVPFPHEPEEHAVFYVATPGYRERRLEDTDLRPLAGGVLDGTPGELVTRCLDGPLPVGVYVTPTHLPGPDVDAALLLLHALEGVYDFEVDEAELEQLSEQLKRYYTELSERMESLGGSDQSLASRDFPEDRMYM